MKFEFIVQLVIFAVAYRSQKPIWGKWAGADIIEKAFTRRLILGL